MHGDWAALSGEFHDAWLERLKRVTVGVIPVKSFSVLVPHLGPNSTYSVDVLNMSMVDLHQEN